MPGSWSNTASALHSSLQSIDALIDRRMEVTGKKKKKDYACQMQSICQAGGQNVCRKSQIVSAKLKRNNGLKKMICTEGHHLASWLKLTGLCSRTSSLKIWEISNAFNIKTAASIISRGTSKTEQSIHYFIHNQCALLFHFCQSVWYQTFLLVVFLTLQLECLSLDSAGI